MKQRSNALLLLTLIILLNFCGEYKKPSRGTFFEVYVALDSTRFNSDLFKAIDLAFSKEIITLPQLENAYDLKYFSIKTDSDVEFIKRSRNVIMAGILNGNDITSKLITEMLSEEVKQEVRNGNVNAIKLEDHWSSNQWILLLIGKSEVELIDFIYENADNYLASLTEKELKRWDYEMFKKGRKVEIEDSLRQKYGWSIKIQHDYFKNIDTLGFVTFRRYMPDNDRWIWVWWEDNVKNALFLDEDWINQKRDSILKAKIQGTREGSYLQTEYRRELKSKTMMIHDNYAVEIVGTWQMVNDLMGGFFVNYTIYDEKNRRLFMIEMAQFAPKYSKRRFFRQFQAMGRTFTVDPDFSDYKLELSDSQ